MKILIKSLLVSLSLCIYSVSFGQYITVDDTKTAQQLVENVLINSPCASVSNFEVHGDTFSPGEQSYGYFTSGTSNFPFTDGIVLATSRANRTKGPNNNLISEGQTAWLGDADLDQALNLSNNTFNATSLEFDFIPQTSKISFDYIFASEEYQGSAPCRYSDGFAFLLKEANTANPYQNLALVPNTTTSVLVTTVHPLVSGPNGCPPENESYFDSYNGSNAPINFNGQTVVMTAKATVIPGLTYHIKLVITDFDNIKYDSAIFLGGGSFKVTTDLGPDRLIATNNPICSGEIYPITAFEPNATSYKWFKNNVQDTSIPSTSATYNATVSGTYKVEITLGNTTCIATGEVKIDYLPQQNLLNTTLVQCDLDGNGITLYNLTTVNSIIGNNNPNLNTIIYYEDINEAQLHNQAQAITNPTAYSSRPKTIYASVSNAFGCVSIATVALQITNNSVPSIQSYESCDLDTTIDGFYGFTLSNADVLLLSGLPMGLVVAYYPSENDAYLGTNLLTSPYTNTIQYQTTIFAKIVNGPDCYGIVPLHLIVNTNSPLNFQDETVILCEGSTISLEVNQTFNSYLWSNSDTDYSTFASSPGDYTVTVSDSNSCLAIKKFTVEVSQKPTIISVTINDFEGNDNAVLIHYTGNGDYEFSLDGIFFQNTPYFVNVPAAAYTAQVRDKNNCGVAFYSIFVLDYPKYFTPNNDGFNDFWTIKNLAANHNYSVSIFDRFGKFLYELKKSDTGWDGKYNAIDVPASDYWFVLNLENGKTIKGNFSLKR